MDAVETSDACGAGATGMFESFGPAARSMRPSGIAAMAGRSTGTRTIRGLRVLGKPHFPSRGCDLASRHADAVVSPTADSDSAAGGATCTYARACDCEGMASFGASAIACKGRSSCPAKRTATLLAPAMKAKAANATATRNLRRRRLDRHKYPNSGCKLRASCTTAHLSSCRSHVAGNKQHGLIKRSSCGSFKV